MLILQIYAYVILIKFLTIMALGVSKQDLPFIFIIWFVTDLSIVLS
jgi:hypothetical protein